MKYCRFLIAIGFLIVSGCATGTVSPGPTLLVGLRQYDDDMHAIGSSVTRWPERQRAGGYLKTVITGTVGASHEFYRLVDLDIKKREYAITMRETSLRPDRLQEMKEDLVKMDDEVAHLKPIVRSQLTNLVSVQQDQRIEGIATIGLLDLALDFFSAPQSGNSINAPFTNVDQYVVTDLGTFSTVRLPQGQIYRCSLFGSGDEGAGIRCEADK